MEWSRIKTIILIILAVTNVSLLGFLVQRELQVQNARQEARQNSIQFLENNGVTVEDETVPEEMTLLPQTVEWDREQEREAAAVLLGGEVQEQAWSDEIYRYYNETGSIQFHRDGTFQGEFVEGAFQLEGQDAAAYSLQVLEILGIQGESLSVQADSGEEDAVTVVCRQLWNQVPVFNHLITLTFREDSLSAVEGRRIDGRTGSGHRAEAHLHPHRSVSVLPRNGGLGRRVQPDRKHHPGLCDQCGDRALGADSGVVYCHGYPELPDGYPDRGAEPGGGERRLNMAVS